MKKGIFIIIQRDGIKVAAVKKPNGQIDELTDLKVTDSLLTLDGQACEYLFSKSQKAVEIKGKSIYNLITVPIVSEVNVQTTYSNIRHQLNADKETEHEKISFQTPSLPDSYVLGMTKVPNDTRTIRFNSIDNFYLKYNRFARFNDRDNKFHLFKNDRKGEAYLIKPNFGNLFNQQNQLSGRIKNSATLLYSRDGQMVIQVFKPDWRLITGLGTASVYKTGMTLHHIYGVPFIPSSGIKGVLRSWVINSEFNNDEKEAFQNKEFCEAFGCPTQSIVGKARKGNLTFFDALPTNSPTIEPDIMNPHYPEYYTGSKAPTDTQSPTPIFFLTVVKTAFEFLIATKAEGWNLNTKLFWQSKTIGQWLEEALSEHGIGAKTAVGYGYMQKV